MTQSQGKRTALRRTHRGYALTPMAEANMVGFVGPVDDVAAQQRADLAAWRAGLRAYRRRYGGPGGANPSPAEPQGPNIGPGVLWVRGLV